MSPRRNKIKKMKSNPANHRLVLLDTDFTKIHASPIENENKLEEGVVENKKKQDPMDQLFD